MMSAQINKSTPFGESVSKIPRIETEMSGGEPLKGKVLSSFQAVDPRQINLNIGEIITIVEEGASGNWSTGLENGSGYSQYDCIS